MKSSAAFSPSDLWDAFIDHLNVVQPLGKGSKTVAHVSFLGSIKSYRSIFLQANRDAARGQAVGQEPQEKAGFAFADAWCDRMDAAQEAMRMAACSPALPSIGYDEVERLAQVAERALAAPPMDARSLIEDVCVALRSILARGGDSALATAPTENDVAHRAWKALAGSVVPEVATYEHQCFFFAGWLARGDRIYALDRSLSTSGYYLTRFLMAGNHVVFARETGQAVLHVEATLRAQKAPSAEEIEQVAVQHEAFGFGQVDERGLTTHGFDPEGMHDFVKDILARWGSALSAITQQA